MALSERISLVTIISWILGGGLIWSVTNLIYNDIIKQPYLDLSLDFYKSTKVATIEFENAGMATAHNIRITITSVSANIDKNNLSVPFSHEEVRLFNDTGSLTTIVANVSRLVPQDLFRISTPLIFTNGQKTTDFNVIVTYNERMQQLRKVINSENDQDAFESGFTHLLNTSITYLIAVMIVVAFLLLQFSFFYKPITKEVISRFYCHKIKQEIKRVSDTLENEQKCSGYDEVFSTDAWESKTTKEKQKILFNYRDFNTINDFYKQLSIRDYNLSNNVIDNERIRIENESCYQKSQCVLSSIRWAKYDLSLRAIFRLIIRIFVPYESFITKIVEAIVDRLH